MDFVADLKHKANKCEYGELEDSLLCDRIIQGIRDKHIKMRLLDLEDRDLTLENCIRICRASELTQQQLKTRKKEEATVHATTPEKNGPYRGQYRGQYKQYRGRWRSRGASSQCQENKCPNCDRFLDTNRCPAYHRFCNMCGEKGHFARTRACKAKCFDRPAPRGRG